ncbi:MAG: hypothetical protein JOY99_11410 [Sphingomonadaceae bacterium]|nr:hypothetical protein [Sphingomonadaceae bacterium]
MYRIVITLAAVAAAPAFAQTPPAPGHVQTQTHVTTATTASKPAVGAKQVAKTTTATTTATANVNGHLVTTKTKTGKTITYDCSKAGNKNKAACKH